MKLFLAATALVLSSLSAYATATAPENATELQKSIARCQAKAVRTAIASALDYRDKESVRVMRTRAVEHKQYKGVVIYTVSLDLCSPQDDEDCGGIEYEVQVDTRFARCGVTRVEIVGQE